MTDVDFETVCKDLFEEVLGVSLEAFTAGPDQGVDLRHVAPEGDTTVVQCKHWRRSGRAALLRHVKDVEAAKVRDLAPARYVLATSVSLTSKAKETLTTTLAPFVRTPGDLYGAAEIVAELRKRPHIVRRHVRLWFTGDTLATVLTKASRERSRDLADDIDATLRTFVPNPSLDRALALLDEHHLCVIAGLPGIGKTTLAQVVAAHHAAAGYDLVELSEDVDEANRAWDDDRPQLFYYDDFLGRNALDAKLHKNEDARLLGLMDRVRRAPDKRLVLTTRDYILAAARERYERLARSDFSPLTCVVDLAVYTRTLRAQMLYNHVFFSDLPRAAKASFAHAEAYEPILEHDNFNPRLVALSLRAAFAEGVEPDAVAAHVVANLDDPAALWSHIVENQLSERDVDLLAVLFSLGGRPLLVHEVEPAWVAFRTARGRDPEPRTLRRALHSLEGTFLRISVPAPGFAYVRFHNPSVVDFLHTYLAESPALVRDLLAGASYWDQVRTLWWLAPAGRGRLMAAFAHDPRPVVDAVLRLRDGPFLNDLASTDVSSLLLVYQVGERLGDPGLRAAFDARLATVTLPVAGIGEGEIALLWHLGHAEDRARRAHFDRLLPQAIEGLVADLVDWETAGSVEELLHGLGDLVPDELLGRVHDEIAVVVGEGIDEWRAGDLAGSPTDIEMLIELADQYCDDIDPAVLDDIRSRLGSEPAQRSKRPAPPGEDWHSVEQIFGGLATFED